MRLGQGPGGCRYPNGDRTGRYSHAQRHHSPGQGHASADDSRQVCSARTRTTSADSLNKQRGQSGDAGRRAIRDPAIYLSADGNGDLTRIRE